MTKLVPPTAEAVANHGAVPPWRNRTDWELPGEVWERIPGYHGRYQASNLGRIRLTKDFRNPKTGQIHRPRVMATHPHPNSGNLTIRLTDFEKRNTHIAKRLIAATFLGESDADVWTRNGDKTDLRVENLYYANHRGEEI